MGDKGSICGAALSTWDDTPAHRSVVLLCHLAHGHDDGHEYGHDTAKAPLRDILDTVKRDAEGAENADSHKGERSDVACACGAPGCWILTIEQRVEMVSCVHCAFAYDAMHVREDGTYSCPECRHGEDGTADRGRAEIAIEGSRR